MIERWILFFLLLDLKRNQRLIRFECDGSSPMFYGRILSANPWWARFEYMDSENFKPFGEGVSPLSAIRFVETFNVNVTKQIAQKALASGERMESSPPDDEAADPARK